MAPNTRGPEPHWMTRLYYTVYGTEGDGGLVEEMKSIKKSINERQSRLELQQNRIVLWGGLIMITWTMLTSRDVNVDLLIRVIDALTKLMKAIFG